MRKLIIIAATFAALLALTATAALAAPGATTHNVVLNAATDGGVVDLPALNSQFTKMTINVNDGRANWGSEDLGYWTSYENGSLSTGSALTSGIWGDESLPGHGPLLLEGAQVGGVISRVRGGAWHEINHSAATIEKTDGGNHSVQVAYND